jgi:hypothetical protein
MRKLILIAPLLVATLSTSGCIVGGVMIAKKVLGESSEKSDTGNRTTISQNYPSSVEETWQATIDEMSARGLEPAPNASLRGNSSTVAGRDISVRVAELSKNLGTSVEISGTKSAVAKARPMLAAIEKRLGDRDQIVVDYARPLQETWDASLAQLQAMGVGLPSGIPTTARSGHPIELERFTVRVRSVTSRTSRVYVIGPLDDPASKARLNEFIDGMTARLQD